MYEDKEFFKKILHHGLCTRKFNKYANGMCVLNLLPHISLYVWVPDLIPIRSDYRFVSTGLYDAMYTVLYGIVNFSSYSFMQNSVDQYYAHRVALNYDVCLDRVVSHTRGQMTIRNNELMFPGGEFSMKRSTLVDFVPENISEDLVMVMFRTPALPAQDITVVDTSPTISLVDITPTPILFDKKEEMRLFEDKLFCLFERVNIVTLCKAKERFIKSLAA